MHGYTNPEWTGGDANRLPGRCIQCERIPQGDVSVGYRSDGADTTSTAQQDVVRRAGGQPRHRRANRRVGWRRRVSA